MMDLIKIKGVAKSCVSQPFTALVLILIIACIFRIGVFPGPNEFREGDERGYLIDGLIVWEGMTPSGKRAANGPLTWITWMVCAVKTAYNLATPTVKERKHPITVRPYFAVDRTLFAFYRNLTGLRHLLITIIALIALVGIWATFEAARVQSGLSGAILASGLLASLPSFVLHSTQVGPYSLAWSFVLIANYFVVCKPNTERSAYAGLFMGLAIASRIDMLQAIPLILWQFWWQSSQRNELVKFSLFTLGTTLIVAPWYLTNLLGELGQIGWVRFVGAQPAMLAALNEFIWNAGMGPVTLALLIGILYSAMKLRQSKSWWLLAYLALLLLGALKRSSGTYFDLRHQGALLITIIIASPLVFSPFTNNSRKLVQTMLLVLLLVLPISQTLIPLSYRTGAASDSAADWIEQHVPIGTTVFLKPSFHDVLPTRESADLLWGEEAGIDAWEKKVLYRLGRVDAKLVASELPRGLSEEHMVSERPMRRRWYILGGSASADQVPRYNIRVFEDSLVFGLSFAQAVDEYNKRGGVLVLDGDSPLELGKDYVHWLNKAGQGVRIYCSPGVVKRLKQ